MLGTLLKRIPGRYRPEAFDAASSQCQSMDHLGLSLEDAELQRLERDHIGVNRARLLRNPRDTPLVYL
jgi:hypothetical protein